MKHLSIVPNFDIDSGQPQPVLFSHKLLAMQTRNKVSLCCDFSICDVCQTDQNAYGIFRLVFGQSHPRYHFKALKHIKNTSLDKQISDSDKILMHFKQPPSFQPKYLQILLFRQFCLKNVLNGTEIHYISWNEL